MVQKRNVLAAASGMLCAASILGLIVLAQTGVLMAPATTPATNLASNVFVATASSTQTGFYANGQALFNMVLGRPAAASSQTIENPSTTPTIVVILGISSLIVGLGAAFVISRRLFGEQQSGTL